MSTRIEKYKNIQNCGNELPNSDTGRTAKEVVFDAENIYLALKDKEETLEGNYEKLDEEETEFVNVYLDKLNELNTICKVDKKENAKSTNNADKILKMESALRGSRKMLDKITDEAKLNKLKSAIRAVEKIVLKLKNE